MNRLRLAALTAGALILAVALGSAPVQAAGLEGRWILTGQSRDTRRADPPEPGFPLVLEFTRTGSRLTGAVRAGPDSRQVFAWPAVVVSGKPLTPSIQESTIDAARGRARARYRLEPPGSGQTIEIIEDYALADDGLTLAGTVTVSVIDDGAISGSYRLQRRFARAP